MDNYNKQERTWNYNPQEETSYGDKPQKINVFWLLVSVVAVIYGIVAFSECLRANRSCTAFDCTLCDAGEMFGVVGRDLYFNKIEKIQNYDNLQATLYYYIDSKDLEVKLRKVYVAEQSKAYFTKEAKDEAFYSILAMAVGLLLLIGQLSRLRNAKVESKVEFANDVNEPNVEYSVGSNAFDDKASVTSTQDIQGSARVEEKPSGKVLDADAGQSQNQGRGKYVLFLLVFGFIAIRSLKMMMHHPSQAGASFMFFVGFVGAIVAFVKLCQGNNGNQQLSETQTGIGSDIVSEEDEHDDADSVFFDQQPTKKEVLLYGDDNYEYRKPNDYAIYHRGNEYVLAVAFDVCNDADYHYYTLDPMEAMMDFSEFGYFASQIRSNPDEYLDREVQNEVILVDVY